MKNKIILGAIAPAMLALGSSVALADTAMPAPPVPQHSAKMPVDQQELHHFAAAVKEIQPIDVQAHRVIASTSMSKKEKHQKLEGYNKQIAADLAQHHLTPERYEMLLQKAENDPSFAKRTESALHKMG